MTEPSRSSLEYRTSVELGPMRRHPSMMINQDTYLRDPAYYEEPYEEDDYPHHTDSSSRRDPMYLAPEGYGRMGVSRYEREISDDLHRFGDGSVPTQSNPATAMSNGGLQSSSSAPLYSSNGQSNGHSNGQSNYHSHGQPYGHSNGYSDGLPPASGASINGGNGGFQSSSSQTTDPLTSVMHNLRHPGSFYQKSVHPKIWRHSTEKTENLAVRIPIAEPPIPVIDSRERRKRLQEEHTRALQTRDGPNPYEFDEDDPEWETVSNFNMEDIRRSHTVTSSLADYTDDSKCPSLNTLPEDAIDAAGSTDHILPRLEPLDLPKPSSTHKLNGVITEEYHPRQVRFQSDSIDKLVQSARSPFKGPIPKLGKAGAFIWPSDETGSEEPSSSRHHPYENMSSQRSRHPPQSAKNQRNSLRPSNRTPRRPQSHNNSPNSAGRRSKQRQPGSARSRGHPQQPRLKTPETPKRARLVKKRDEVYRLPPTTTSVASPYPQIIGGVVSASDQDFSFILSSPPPPPVGETSIAMYSKRERAELKRLSKQKRPRRYAYTPTIIPRPFGEDPFYADKVRRCDNYMWLCALTVVLLPFLAMGKLDDALDYWTNAHLTQFKPETRRKAWWVFFGELLVLIVVIIIAVVVHAAKSSHV